MIMVLDSALPYSVYNLQDGGKFGQAAAAVPDEKGKLCFEILGINGRVLLPFEYDRITIFSDMDNETNTWKERTMAEKGGENFSFDISKR